MNFVAKLRRNSTIHRNWVSARRIGGSISGVQFKKDGAVDFISVDDPLPPEAVAALVHHNMIDLEVTTTPVGEVVAKPKSTKGSKAAKSDADDSNEGESDDVGSESEEGAEPADPMAALWRNKPPVDDGDEGPQKPVMRPRGRSTGSR